jgi:CheY-like chemotaxis protein
MKCTFVQVLVHRYVTSDPKRGKLRIFGLENTAAMWQLEQNPQRMREPNPRMDDQMRVLIVEDSLVLRRLVETCLRDFDCEFDMQRLPHSPQRLGGFEESDLVIIGVYQPFSIGLGIIDRLKNRTEPPGVVAITTDTRDNSVAQIREAGADAVVKMPFRPDDLRDAVTAALDSGPIPPTE